ncbi:TIGR03089 family protein [soil metagenome]
MHQLSVSDLFAQALTRDPSGPLLTYYDDATGERTELSATTLDNWVAKTANLLTDGLGLDDGACIAVVLPPHWQTAGIILGAWSAGHLVVDYPDVASAAPPDAVFCTEADLVVYDDVRCDVVGLTLDPWSRGFSGARRGIDYAREIGGYGDQFRRSAPVDPTAPALRAGSLELSHEGLAAAAVELAERLGMTAGGRLMISRDLAVAAGPLSWLLAPLAAGTSVVLVTDANSDRLPARAESERVTATLGIELAGLPVLGG